MVHFYLLYFQFPFFPQLGNCHNGFISHFSSTRGGTKQQYSLRKLCEFQIFVENDFSDDFVTFLQKQKLNLAKILKRTVSHNSTVGSNPRQHGESNIKLYISFLHFYTFVITFLCYQTVHCASLFPAQNLYKWSTVNGLCKKRAKHIH